jgi:hypothetical protein
MCGPVQLPDEPQESVCGAYWRIHWCQLPPGHPGWPESGHECMPLPACGSRPDPFEQVRFLPGSVVQ